MNLNKKNLHPSRRPTRAYTRYGSRSSLINPRSMPEVSVRILKEVCSEVCTHSKTNLRRFDNFCKILQKNKQRRLASQNERSIPTPMLTKIPSASSAPTARTARGAAGTSRRSAPVARGVAKHCKRSPVWLAPLGEGESFYRAASLPSIRRKGSFGPKALLSWVSKSNSNLKTELVLFCQNYLL